MLSPKPVIGSLIALGLAIFALVLMQDDITLHNFGTYKNYISIGILVFAGLHVIRSSMRSLFVPLLITIAGAVISHFLANGETLFSYHAAIYQYVMIAGIFGICISMFNIH
jgi:multisubunit Na+/H+ antiporter MnhG subunit